MQPVVMTSKGLSNLERELVDLRSRRRPDLLGRVRETITHGDCWENPDLEILRSELAYVDQRIDELEVILGSAQIVQRRRTHLIEVGSWVLLRQDGEEEWYQVVGDGETGERSLTYRSPVGQAILGKAAGESVEVETPGGKIYVEILGIGDGPGVDELSDPML